MYHYKYSTAMQLLLWLSVIKRKQVTKSYVSYIQDIPQGSTALCVPKIWNIPLGSRTQSVPTLWLVTGK